VASGAKLGKTFFHPPTGDGGSTNALKGRANS
jgi:hypothetical protein